MAGKRNDAWLMAGIDAWRLGLDASTVIGLRMMTFAGGGEAARKEAALMVSEKIGAAMELQMTLMTAPFAATPLATTQATLKHYRRKVGANRRRLSR